jgi:hypothetical protein
LKALKERKALMIKPILTCAAAIFLVSCSETTGDLTAKTEPTTIDSKENYQSVYRRLSKYYDCIDGAWAGTYASFQVDRQLYSELGFGELSLRLNNFGVNNYYTHVKVSKTNGGSRTVIHSGNSLAANKARNILAEIATNKRPPTCHQS